MTANKQKNIASIWDVMLEKDAENIVDTNIVETIVDTRNQYGSVEAHEHLINKVIQQSPF